jgi:hypothetical protein
MADGLEQSRAFRCNYPDDCPPVRGENGCCSHCKHHSETGCELGDGRPQYCKEYDCRDYAVYCKYVWIGHAWQLAALSEVPMIKCDREFIKKYNDLMDWKSRDGTR